VTKDYFDKELKKAQQKFNQTFGMLTVCDLQLRQSAILAIVFLGRVGNRITKTKNDNDRRCEIRKFMQTRHNLNSIFDKVEHQQKEQFNRKDDLKMVETMRN